MGFGGRARNAVMNVPRLSDSRGVPASALLFANPDMREWSNPDIWRLMWRLICRANMLCFASAARRLLFLSAWRRRLRDLRIARAMTPAAQSGRILASNAPAGARDLSAPSPPRRRRVPSARFSSSPPRRRRVRPRGPRRRRRRRRSVRRSVSRDPKKESTPAARPRGQRSTRARSTSSSRGGRPASPRRRGAPRRRATFSASRGPRRASVVASRARRARASVARGASG